MVMAYIKFKLVKVPKWGIRGPNLLAQLNLNVSCFKLWLLTVKQSVEKMLKIDDVGIDGIRTVDLWYQKRPHSTNCAKLQKYLCF